jgi:hypothetical protein
MAVSPASWPSAAIVCSVSPATRSVANERDVSNRMRAGRQRWSLEAARCDFGHEFPPTTAIRNARTTATEGEAMNDIQSEVIPPSTSADGMFSTSPPRSTQPVPMCGARTRSGVQCRKSPVPGRERCRLHNGNARRGTDHPRFRHGLYSKCLKRDLRAEYERLLASPELLSARSDVAALRVRLRQLAARLGTGESSTRWTQIRETFGDFRRASKAGETAKMVSSLNHMEALITGAADDENSWGDFAAMVDRVTLIAAREHRRLAEEQLAVSVADVHVLVASIADCVLREVRDPNTRTRIADHIEKLHVLDKTELDAVVRSHAKHADDQHLDLWPHTGD